MRVQVPPSDACFLPLLSSISPLGEALTAPELWPFASKESQKYRLGQSRNRSCGFRVYARSSPSERLGNGYASLTDLIERGLDPERALLVVIDGAKALRKAVLEVFGARVLLHRCHAHKKRNVAEALPQRMRAPVHSAMNQAYATGDPKRAHRLLENLARRLESEHPGAAASLREGLDETLTVMRLGLPENLERVLSSTNLIENLFSRVREIARRVKRWQGGTMILRWTAAGVLDAERHFRKIAGYRALPKLVAALRAHDAALDRQRRVDNRKQAA